MQQLTAGDLDSFHGFDPAGLFNAFEVSKHPTEGWERFVADELEQSEGREVNLDDTYLPHPIQQAFHESPAKHRLLGGSAGPGKSLALIMDQLVAANQFSDPTEAGQVHTLLLRRTFAQLEGSLIPRFREKVPRELYRSYNDQKKAITWLNGAQTHFGAMQYEQDVWKYQGGQYLKIGFDELTQFLLYQWTTISAWNRCPVCPWATKDGATNPVGVSAADFAALFGADGKGKRAAGTMDDHQRRNYNPADYAYFPCTYKDNPIYANDPVFLANLENYPKPIRDALKLGIWGSLGTYFDIWDPALHVYDPREIQMESWWPKWLSLDWGFEHNFAAYWMTLDPNGQVVRIYREWVDNHHEPKELAEGLVKRSVTIDGETGLSIREKLEPWAYLSHDAFHKKQSANTIALQINEILKRDLGVQFLNAGLDKKGGEQMMYSKLKRQVRVGEYRNELTGDLIPITVPELQISKDCPRLAAIMPMAPRDMDDDPETIADFLGNDPIDGARYGVYGKFSGKIKIPVELEIAARVTSDDPTVRHLQSMKAEQDLMRERTSAVVKPRRWKPSTH